MHLARSTDACAVWQISAVTSQRTPYAVTAQHSCPLHLTLSVKCCSWTLPGSSSWHWCLLAPTPWTPTMHYENLAGHAFPSAVRKQTQGMTCWYFAQPDPFCSATTDPLEWNKPGQYVISTGNNGNTQAVWYQPAKQTVTDWVYAFWMTTAHWRRAEAMKASRTLCVPTW